MLSKILLFSGGLDSLIAWFYLDKPSCLYVELGHRYCEDEKKTIRQLMIDLPELNVRFDNRLMLGDFEDPTAYIPLRNHFLVAIGALYAQNIYIVLQKGERTLPDRSERFLTQSSNLLSYLQSNSLKVDTPFLEVTKQKMVKWFLETDKISYSKSFRLLLLQHSRSCYRSGAKECGDCPACFRKWIALEANGIESHNWFIVHPAKTELAIKYAKDMLSGKYDLERTQETLEVLKRYEIISQVQMEVLK